MTKKYKLIFTYPDGHVEEIAQAFDTEKQAIEYGNSLLAQVAHTEDLRSNKAYIDEGNLFKRDPIKPYFTIDELSKGESTPIFDSRDR